MFPVSNRFLRACKNSGKRKTVVDVYQDNIKVLADIPVVGGSIRVDRNSRSRRSGSMDIGSPDLFPKFTSDILAPLGTEIIIRSGMVYPDGDEELIPLGTFIITDISAEEENGLLPRVEFMDRAHRVFETSTHNADEAEVTVFGDPISGHTTQAALESMIVYPAPGWPSSPLWGLTIQQNLPDIPIPGGQFAGDTDRWEIAQSLATSMGCEIFFDNFGQCVCQRVPGITSSTTFDDAIWTIEPGEGGTLISLSTSISRNDTYNSVVVLGSTPDGATKQPMATVYDLNISSPTYYHGPFGKKTLRVSDSKLTTEKQCKTAAQGILKNTLGIAKNVTFGAIANPALDAGDIILLKYPDGRQELHIIDSYDLPFSQGIMTAETRSVQLAVG